MSPNKYHPSSKHISEPLGVPTSKAVEIHWIRESDRVIPHNDLVPELSDTELAGLDRRSRVALHVAKGVINHTNFRNPNDEFRPKSIGERTMAWRMQSKLGKATIRLLEASKIADQYLEPSTVDDPSSNNPWRPKTKEVKTPNFKAGQAHLSAGEKRRIRKDEKRYNRLHRQVNRLVHGRKMPMTDSSVLGFEQFISVPDTKTKTAKSVDSAAKNKAEATFNKAKEAGKRAAVTVGKTALKGTIILTLAAQDKASLGRIKVERGAARAKQAGEKAATATNKAVLAGSYVTKNVAKSAGTVIKDKVKAKTKRSKE